MKSFAALLVSISLAATPLCAQQSIEPPLPPEHTGMLYLSGFSSHNVGEYLPNGDLVRTFSDPSMQAPRGIAVDEYGNIVVVCQGSDRILVFDLDGTLLRTVTHPELQSGTGIARAGSGDWYVANFSPGAVLVFDSDWNYRGKIDGNGLLAVNCIAFDADGSFAVTNAAQSRMHLYNKNHRFLRTVTHASIGSPMSIALDSRGNHYVSNGGTGVITKFDRDWKYLMHFGAGIVSVPQGVVIDGDDIITVTNTTGSTVHRFDTQGVFLGAITVQGVTTARNGAYQSSPFVLARKGSVDADNGYPARVLSVNGQTGDVLGRLNLGATDPIQVDVDASPSGPVSAPFVLYAWPGEPSLSSVEELPFRTGYLAQPPLHQGGAPLPIVNSIGFPGLLGRGRFPAKFAPATALKLPAGLGSTGSFTLQAILADLGSRGQAGYSVSNTLVVRFQ